jgi:hypothetical protein
MERRHANWCFVAPFSGKLSPVMPNSSEPAEGDPAAAAPGAEAKPQEAGPQGAGGRMPPQLAPRGEIPREVGGREGPEPTRFGDWELRGRCIDF